MKKTQERANRFDRKQVQLPQEDCWYFDSTFGDTQQVTPPDCWYFDSTLGEHLAARINVTPPELLVL